MNNEELAKALGNLTIPELVALTKSLEEQWGVSSAPMPVAMMAPVQVEAVVEDKEVSVILASVPADKKMSVIKMVRDVIQLGLKEAKDLVESAPKVVKENISKEEAELLKARLVEAGAVVEIK